jgi:hypothetical protein
MCNSILPEKVADNVPNQHFWGTPPTWVMDEFYLASGKFMNDFARAEAVLYHSLSRLIRELHQERHSIENDINTIQEKKLRKFARWVKGDSENLESELLTSRQKTEFWKMIEGISALVEWAGKPEHIVQSLKNFLVHIRSIAVFRNAIAHNGAVPDLSNKDGWYYTSCVKNDPDILETRYFQNSLLESASSDISVMEQRFMHILYPDDPYIYSNHIAEFKAKGFPTSAESQQRLDLIIGDWQYDEARWLWSAQMQTIHGY